METMQFDRTQDIAEGKRTLMYEPPSFRVRLVGDVFGATRWGDLNVLVCIITEVEEVNLLDDLQKEESVRDLARSREDLFQRWKIAFPGLDVSTNPLVTRVRFKWTGKTETRKYQSIIEEEDARCLAEMDAAVMALSNEETPSG